MRRRKYAPMCLHNPPRRAASAPPPRTSPPQAAAAAGVALVLLVAWAAAPVAAVASYSAIGGFDRCFQGQGQCALQQSRGTAACTAMPAQRPCRPLAVPTQTMTCCMPSKPPSSIPTLHGPPKVLDGEAPPPLAAGAFGQAALARCRRTQRHAHPLCRCFATLLRCLQTARRLPGPRLPAPAPPIPGSPTLGATTVHGRA